MLDADKEHDVKVIYDKSDQRVPIKAWLSEVDEGTLGQARNLARLPFIKQHVALMPDAHVGYGMPIGGVIATENVVIPYAVGNDIGCFTGETRVPLLDGSQRTLFDLYQTGQAVWVYALDESQHIVPAQAHCLKTRVNAELVEVVISGGERITCTPDHLFMLRDGSYREARDLRFNDSLMPLYRSYETRDGYERVWHPGGNTNRV